MRFYHTYDLDYARRIYPFLVETADFWQDYLQFEDERYIIYGDARLCEGTLSRPVGCE